MLHAARSWADQVSAAGAKGECRVSSDEYIRQKFLSLSQWGHNQRDKMNDVMIFSFQAGETQWQKITFKTYWPKMNAFCW